jgi:hypothetical protein
MSVSFFTTALVVGKLELGGLLTIKNLHALLLEFSLSGSMSWGVQSNRCCETAGSNASHFQGKVTLKNLKLAANMGNTWAPISSTPISHTICICTLLKIPNKEN